MICAVQIFYENAGRNRARIANIMGKLAAAREEATAAARAKSEFLASMSHEIRTPMNAVIGMTELLSRGSLSTEHRRYVEIMKANGDALLDLINDILDLAKIESGRLNLERVNFDLEDLIDKAGETMGIRAHEKGLELAMRIAPDVPVNLVGDPLRLRQILVNLFGNAVKFTERGVIDLTVERVGAAIPNNAANGAEELVLNFSVRDTGIGIPKDKLGDIFSSFTQADASTTRHYGGSGLGLSIVKRLVELYGGKIGVESVPGLGSRFTFTAKFGVQAPQAAAAPSFDLSGVNVLVADSSPINRAIVTEILAGVGVKVAQAGGAACALDEFNRAAKADTPFRIALVACGMPLTDGVDLVSQLRNSNRAGGGLEIIAMLATNQLTTMPPKLRELGIRAHVVKPIRRRELLAAVHAAITGAAPEKGALDEAVPQLSPLKMLLADDSQVNRFVVQSYLEGSQSEVAEAANGSEAIEAFKKGRFDVVLMDMRMPVVDGYAATRAIRAWELERGLPRTPIIALTASALDEQVKECLAAGCDLHVSKPVRQLELVEAIAQVTKVKPVRSQREPQPQAGEEINPKFRDLVPDFLKDKRAGMPAILAAVENGDYESVAGFAHQFIGDSGILGFRTMSDLGRALEKAANSADRDVTMRLARELSHRLEQAGAKYG
ncbi:MAG: response regulator [Candidatus Binataceae bacterium]